ncbi:MAG: DUF3322 domain-containing protein, partial [Verrucomicrobiota bacterium]
MNWTRPQDLRAQVARLWERGLVLASVFPDASIFPKRLVLKAPSSSELAHAFAEAREWCQQLARMPHLRFEHREVKHRVTGTNAYPSEA